MAGIVHGKPNLGMGKMRNIIGNMIEIVDEFGTIATLVY